MIWSASWLVVASCVTTEQEVASVLAPLAIVTDPASAERVEKDAPAELKGESEPTPKTVDAPSPDLAK